MEGSFVKDTVKLNVPRIVILVPPSYRTGCNASSHFPHIAHKDSLAQICSVIKEIPGGI